MTQNRQLAPLAYTKADDIEKVWSEQFLMDIDLRDRQQCFFNTQSLQLPGIGMSLFSGSCSSMTRSVAQAADASQDVMLCIAFSANVRVSRSGAEATYLPGEAHVWMADQSTQCRVDDDYSAIMFNLPASSLRGIDIDQSLDRGIVNGSGELQLLIDYARNTLKLWGSLNDNTVNKAATHLRELACMALSADHAFIAGEQIDQQQSVRAARLARIKADIQNNLQKPGLSPAWIAAREGISSRYLRDLLADEQTNFSRLVLDLRLQQSYQLLTDLRYLHQPISAIAFGCGFGDLSYFCRVFKRRFSCTPSDIRPRAIES